MHRIIINEGQLKNRHHSNSAQATETGLRFCRGIFCISDTGHSYNIIPSSSRHRRKEMNMETNLNNATSAISCPLNKMILEGLQSSGRLCRWRMVSRPSRGFRSRMKSWINEIQRNAKKEFNGKQNPWNYTSDPTYPASIELGKTAFPWNSGTLW